jgi:hypothetical protein
LYRGDPSIWDLWWKKYWDRLFIEYLDFFPLRASFHPLACCGYLVTRNCWYSTAVHLKTPHAIENEKIGKRMFILTFR